MNSCKTTNPLTPFFSNPKPISASKPSHLFLTLSSKTTTITTTITTITTFTPTPLPPKPKPKTPPPKPPSQTTLDPDFQSKALFLDSIGIDSLSLLTQQNNTTSPSSFISTTSLSDLKTLFSYLTSFHFTPKDLTMIISMCPELLSLTLPDILPVFTFLLRECNVPAALLPRVIRRRPRLLASSVDTRLRPTLYFLQSIGIHEIYKHTDLLSCSVEDKFMPKIHYFENVGFSYKDAVSMFRRFPPLFCYSVKENYEPKFNYFVVEMGRELKELKEFPQYFSFSLENRIKPRHQSCVELGVCFPLKVMLKMKEHEFRLRLDACCNSSMPRSSSPLWCANHCDVVDTTTL